jgi:hypothetical protein
MIVASLSELPQVYLCRACGETKPIEQIIVVRLRKKRLILVRARCKECYNARERGHRRPWKRNYLRKWREEHAELNRSYHITRYWRDPERFRAQVRDRVRKHHWELLVQKRFWYRGVSISLQDAAELIAKYGRCYPTPLGLTPDGRRECERIRSRMRYHGEKLSAFEIRLMVYEDGLFIEPRWQPKGYSKKGCAVSAWRAAHRGLRDPLRAQD